MKILAPHTCCKYDPGQVNVSDHLFSVSKRQGRRGRVLALFHHCYRDQSRQGSRSHLPWLCCHTDSAVPLASSLPFVSASMKMCSSLNTLSTHSTALINMPVSQTPSRPRRRGVGRHCPGPHGAWGAETCPRRGQSGWPARVTRTQAIREVSHARLWHRKDIWQEVWRKGSPPTLLLMQTGVATGGTVWGFLREPETALPYDPASHSWTHIQRKL